MTKKKHEAPGDFELIPFDEPLDDFEPAPEPKPKAEAKKRPPRKRTKAKKKQPDVVIAAPEPKPEVRQAKAEKPIDRFNPGTTAIRNLEKSMRQNRGPRIK